MPDHTRRKSRLLKANGSPGELTSLSYVTNFCWLVMESMVAFQTSNLLAKFCEEKKRAFEMCHRQVLPLIDKINY